MATRVAYRLEPRSAFHFGERGIGLEETAETFRSDSLFSAICMALREGWGAATLERVLAAFRTEGEAPFVVSSCFPYAGDVLFFPRPMLPVAGDLPLDAGKRLKSVRFVSADVLTAWLTGQAIGERMTASQLVADGRAWVSDSERQRLSARFAAGRNMALPSLWSRESVPRVTIDRQTSATVLYRCGRLSFREGCGLFFLVEWRDEGDRATIEAALHVLGDAGLGGRRSAGYGQFQVSAADGPALPEDAAAPLQLLLSLYWPTVGELEAGALAAPASFDLVARHGWISSPEGRTLRRKDVRMLVEGSVV